ncbi:MAG: right-handed parallel beta-helix repeat-containing protein [Lysobacterales bacterium]
MHTRARTLTLMLALLGSAQVEAAILRAGSTCTYATPQLAFAAANNNDTVRVRSGNYPGPFVITRTIRVEGGYDDCSSSLRSGRSDFHGNAPASSTSSLLTVGPSAGVVQLDRISLRDNRLSSGDGAGIHVSTSTLQLSAVEIRNNRALAGNGGGIYLNNATVELQEDATVLLENNWANAGGGIAANGNVARVLFDLGLVGGAATLRNNTLNAGMTLGSAIYLYNGGDARLIDTTILVEAGQPVGPNSGIYIADSASLSGLLLRDSQLVFQNATRYAAITALGANAQIDISDTLVQGWRNGLVLRDGSAVMHRVEFRENNVFVGALGGSGAGIRLLGNAQLEGHSLQFIDNAADEGGAIAVLENASWSLFGAPGLPTRFVNNHAVDVAGFGGAIYHNSTGSGSINNSLAEWGLVEFIDNGAASGSGSGQGRGGAIYVDSSPAVQLVFRSPLIFSGNTAPWDGGAINLNRGHLRLDARVGEQIEFSNNTTDRDGGAIFRASGNQLLINQDAGSHGSVLFDGNTAILGRGGAIAALGVGELRIQAPVQFTHSGPNSTSDYGGQLYAAAGAGQLSVVELQGWDGVGRGISIAGGYAEYDGGGAYLSGVSATLDWVQFGTLQQPNRLFAGGGANLTADLAGTDVKLRNCALRYGSSVTDNNSHGLLVDAGAVVLMESVFGVAGTPPVAGAAWPCESATLGHEAHCSEISDNGNLTQFGGSIGGGASVENGAQLTLKGVSMDGNVGRPGALHVASGGNVTARNVRISQNGGGIKLDAGAQMDAEHLTLTGNTGIALELANSAGTQMTLARSIVWSNSSGIVKGAQATLNFDCNISQTAPFGLNANPVLVDTARGLYRLGAGSAAIDLCLVSGQTSDLDGRARPAGNGFDAGAFEATASLPDALFANGFE